MRIESPNFAEKMTPPLAGVVTEADSFDWAGLEYLADPPAPPLAKRLLAQTLFSLGAARIAESFAKRGGFLAQRHDNKGSVTPVTQPRFAILCYHRIGRGGVPVYSGLPTAVFESQINYLRNHYRIVSLVEMIEEMNAPVNSDPAVAITFDDGYADLYTQAFPVLQKYKVPATVYLTAGAIETGKVAWYDRVFVAFQVAPSLEFELPFDPPRQVKLSTPRERLKVAVEFITLMRKLPAAEWRNRVAKLEAAISLPRKSMMNRMLSWPQIRMMSDGGVSFGAHTMTHPVVSRLDETELSVELGDSKKLIENRLQQPVLDFAFPFGKADECGSLAVDYLSRLGYRSATTTIEGLNGPGSNPLFLKRVSFCEERSLAIFAIQLSRLFLSSEPEETNIAPVQGSSHNGTNSQKSSEPVGAE